MYRTIENPCGLQKTYGKQNARKMIRINSAGTQLCCLPMSQSISFQKAKACLSLFCCHSHDSYAEEILEPFLATVSVILQNQNSARDWLWPFTTFNCSTVFAPAVAHGVRRTHASRLAGSISELQRIWQRKHVIRDGHSECRAMYTCTQLTHNFAESHVFNDRTRLFFFPGRICMESWWHRIAASWMDDMESERKEAIVIFGADRFAESAWTKAIVERCGTRVSLFAVGLHP